MCYAVRILALLNCRLGGIPGPGEAAVRLCPSQLRGRAWWGWSRWALRWRNQDAVRQVADVLGRDAAEYMVRSLVPLDSLS